MPRGLALVALIFMGLGWGATVPLGKIAVSEGYRHFGLIFWQMVIAVVVLGVMVRLRGSIVKWGPRQMFVYCVIALIGTILPNSASYTAAIYLPAAILGIIIATVPMFSFPIAIAIGNDQFHPLRVLGLLFGLAGVLFLLLPTAVLPDRALLWFIPLALVAPFFYGIEGNFVAKFGTAGMGPIATLFGASVVGSVLSFPLAVLSGQWISPLEPLGLPAAALVVSSLLHAAVYSTYVWLVGRTGAVFASQVSYLVTLFAVGWSWLLLDEALNFWFLLSLGAMFVGLALVSPKSKSNTSETGNNHSVDTSR